MLFLTVLAFNLIGDRVARQLRHPGGGAVSDGSDGTRRPAAGPRTGTLLEVTDLHTSFRTPRGKVRAVDGVSFTLDRGRALGIVGESGSGKTVLSRSMMGLLTGRNVERTGSVRFEGQEMLDLTPKQMRHIWGQEMSMIFQDPMTSLNPLMKIGKQITEPLRAHLGLSRSDATGDRRAAAARRPHPRGRTAGSTSTRTSCPAACASG